MTVENLVWLRNDLRLDDNPALSKGCDNGNIRIVFIVSLKQWKKHNVSDASIGLRLDLVKDISNKCNKLGIKLDVLECDWFKETPKLLLSFCRTKAIKHLWFNRETPVDENSRDKHVIEHLQKSQIKVNAESYDLIVSQPVFNLSDLPFKVFTAYYKKWLIMLENQNNEVFMSPKKQANDVINDLGALEKHQFKYREDLWPSDSETIEQKLIKFSLKKMFVYEQYRDFPNIPATSLLSPYLALGCLGPRQCVQQIKKSYSQSKNHIQNDWLDDGWLRELAWRDFYRQLMIHNPHISKNQDYKSNTKNLPWREDTKSFDMWCRGQTGFPIIDAAMRQLNQTGWMHNRLRMLAASFLTKLLFIDWRKGEKYFMQTLIDGEFAANNGGWQWSASTGCDSAPYFRVFNPILQSAKFDKDGEFIRKFVPEISKLDNKSIHNPTTKQRQECDYATPIVDYKMARLRAIELFKLNS
ncbi:MAG: deoxyribodipyrimidine photo-lyase [Marinicellaceae bacterium]